MFGSRTSYTGAVQKGGGVRLMPGGLIENCTIARNYSSSIHGGVYMAGGAITNSIIVDNAAAGAPNDVSYSDWIVFSCSPDLTNGAGNITNYPVFAEPGSGYGTNALPSSCRLVMNVSPCLDKGTNLEWQAGALDLDGKTRCYRGYVDMGAYELHASPGTIMTIR